MISDKETARIRQEMWTLHPVERLSALLLTIVQCNKDTKMGIGGMLAAIKAMSALHGTQKRGEFANLLRDAADEVERPLQLVN